jgi:hypothetical protein
MLEIKNCYNVKELRKEQTRLALQISDDLYNLRAIDRGEIYNKLNKRLLDTGVVIGEIKERVEYLLNSKNEKI